MAAAANDAGSGKTRGSRFWYAQSSREARPGHKSWRGSRNCTTEGPEATDCFGWGSHKKHEQECIRDRDSGGVGFCRWRGLLGARPVYGA